MKRRKILAIGLCSALLSLISLPGCQRDSDTQKEKATAAPPAAASRDVADHPADRAIAAFNERDWNDFMSIWRPQAELIVLDSSQEPLHGRQAIGDYIKRLLFAFPDAHITPVRILDGGEVWLIEVLLAGTQLGEFLAQPVSEKRVGTQLAIYAWIEDGQISRALLCANPLAILRQIQAGAGERRWLPPAALRSELIRASGSPQRIKAVRAFYRLFETADLAALSRHVTGDVVIHAHGDGHQLQGIETVRLTLVQEREAFDGRIELQDAFAAGPYVAAVVQVHGSLKTDVGPLKATGKAFAERGIDIFRFDGDRIAEWDNYRNLLDLMRQLGLKPTAQK